MIGHVINEKLIMLASSKYALKKAVKNELRKFDSSLLKKKQSIDEMKDQIQFSPNSYSEEEKRIITLAVARLQQLD